MQVAGLLCETPQTTPLLPALHGLGFGLGAPGLFVGARERMIGRCCKSMNIRAPRATRAVPSGRVLMGSGFALLVLSKSGFAAVRIRNCCLSPVIPARSHASQMTNSVSASTTKNKFNAFLSPFLFPWTCLFHCLGCLFSWTQLRMSFVEFW